MSRRMSPLFIVTSCASQQVGTVQGGARFFKQSRIDFRESNVMGKHKSRTLFLLLIVLSIIWVKEPLGLPVVEKSKPLHQIKKLYVVDQGTGIVKTHDARGNRLMTEDEVREFFENEKARYQRMASLLEQELRRVGFDVVKDVNDADAELVGIIGARSSSLPDAPDWNRRYVYRIMLPAKGQHFDFFNDKGKLWESDFRIDRKIVPDESDKRVAIKVADSLLKAWLKSAKKAGIPVGDKVQ
jgi:hypothetical protein